MSGMAGLFPALGIGTGAAIGRYTSALDNEDALHAMQRTTPGEGDLLGSGTKPRGSKIPTFGRALGGGREATG
jgi:hypothetical protein